MGYFKSRIVPRVNYEKRNDIMYLIKGISFNLDFPYVLKKFLSDAIQN